MKVLVPSSWNDVTVGEYMQIAALPTDETPSQRSANIISILTNIDNPFSLDTTTIVEIHNLLKFLDTELPKDRLSSFKHDGIEYEWIRSFGEITIGEQISIEQTIETEELNYAESFDLVMAVLLVEKGKKFDSNKLKEMRKLYSTFPIDKVYSMLLFFLSGGVLSSTPTREYLVVKKMKRTKVDGLKRRERLTKRLRRKALTVVLNGLQWLTGSLRMTLLNMN
tara:strand:- start:2041 stop:2709 length:669 start_codon:yes stop_codon:yes gene_type:complete